LVATLQIGDLLGEKMPVGTKLENRADPVVADRPDVLRGIENRLRPETEGAAIAIKNKMTAFRIIVSAYRVLST